MTRVLSWAGFMRRLSCFEAGSLPKPDTSPVLSTAGVFNVLHAKLKVAVEALHRANCCFDGTCIG